MRFLGVTETCDLASLYLRLSQAGHEVKVAVSEPLARGTAAGLVPRTDEWRSELDWIRGAGADGVILFEAVSEGLGALQDELRRDGFNVVGGSAFGDRLENDRAFAQALLADLGFPAGHVREYRDGAEADAFLQANPGRYVLKFSGPGYASSDNYVGLRSDGLDVRAMLAARLRQQQGAEATFILMDHIEGVEMGIGAYFNGEHFLLPACLDWEHKRFFAGDMGELTGEMGTVATFDRSDGFFRSTLALIEPQLRAAGHIGYVNINTIVNEAGIWPLEFTSRFGYPGYAVLEPLQATPWADLLGMMASGRGEQIATRPGFSTGIVVTTPPFPYSRKEVDEAIGLPVLFDAAVDDEDRRNFHPGEIGMEAGQLVTSGLYGWTMVVTGTGPTIAASRQAAYRRAERVSIPNMRYRLDIGERLAGGEYDRLEALGLLDPVFADG